MNKQKILRILKKIMPIITVLALVAAGYLYYQMTQLKKSPQATVAKETKEVVSKVSKLVALPTDEQPTIATVADPALLKDQAFFAKAEKGDKVLIYTNAKKAILYSVKMNKVIDIAPLNIGNTPPPATATPAVDESTEN